MYFKRNNNSFIDSNNSTNRYGLYQSWERIIMACMWIHTLLDMGDQGGLNERIFK